MNCLTKRETPPSEEVPLFQTDNFRHLLVHIDLRRIFQFSEIKNFGTMRGYYLNGELRALGDVKEGLLSGSLLVFYPSTFVSRAWLRGAFKANKLIGGLSEFSPDGLYLGELDRDVYKDILSGGGVLRASSSLM